MSLLRTFIAVDIPASIQQAIRQQVASLRTALSRNLVRWVAVENIHLTLKFLGEVSPTSVEMLTQRLRVEAEQVAPFDLTVGGLGSFPSLKRPRVLFVGIQAPAGLEALYRGIASACARLGYESEARGFTPHLTLGRVKPDLAPADQQTLRSALADFHIDSLGTARVDSVHLYKSDLQPQGSVYTKLFSAALQDQRSQAQNSRENP